MKTKFCHRPEVLWNQNDGIESIWQEFGHSQEWDLCHWFFHLLYGVNQINPGSDSFDPAGSRIPRPPWRIRETSRSVWGLQNVKGRTFLFDHPISNSSLQLIYLRRLGGQHQQNFLKHHHVFFPPLPMQPSETMAQNERPSCEDVLENRRHFLLLVMVLVDRLGSQKQLLRDGGWTSHFGS